MWLQRTDHVHRVSRRVREAVHRQGNGAARGEVGVGAIARAADALKFRDEMAGTAVDGLAREWPRQHAIEGVDLLHHGIAHGQRLVHSRRVGGEVLRETGIEKQAFTDRIFRGRDLNFSPETRGLSRAAYHYYKRHRAKMPAALASRPPTAAFVLRFTRGLPRRIFSRVMDGSLLADCSRLGLPVLRGFSNTR